jgi:uncharacterized protein (DUF1697 family)
VTVYLLLFRGVGGATQLPVKPLRDALTAAGFKNVGTYINSGNAWLETRLGRPSMHAKVAAICEKQFGYSKPIYTPTLAEWDTLIANNPFPGFTEGKHLHAAWLDGVPPAGALATLRALAVPGEGIEVVGNVAYLHTPHGFGTSKLAEKFDRGIGVPNTARNWNTVLKLRELSASRA